MADKPKKKKVDKRVFKESERQKLLKFRETRGAFGQSLAETAFGKAAFKRAKKGETSRPAKPKKPKKK